jgi:hypothetical protein
MREGATRGTALSAGEGLAFCSRDVIVRYCDDLILESRKIYDEAVIRIAPQRLELFREIACATDHLSALINPMFAIARRWRV